MEERTVTRSVLACDTARAASHQSDTILHVSQSGDATEDRGEVVISRDTAGKPVRIAWTRSGRSTETVRVAKRSDNWFHGLNATRYSEAVADKEEKKAARQENESKKQGHPHLVFVIILLLLLAGMAMLCARLAKKGGGDEA